MANNSVDLSKPKTISPEALAATLDYLASRPFREVNGLISRLMTELKEQEGERGTVRLDKDSAGRGDSSVGGGGVSPLEGVSPNR